MKNVSNELVKLQRKHMRGNKDAWPLVEFHIDTIRGLDFDEEQFLKTRMKSHLGISEPEENRNNAGTRILLDIAGSSNRKKRKK